MIRKAQRPLTGPVRPWRGEPEVKTGHRPAATNHYRAQREGWHGQPAVTVDLNAERSGARTFEDPAELRTLAQEINEAAAWLALEQREASA